jgi:mevalonate kinase
VSDFEIYAHGKLLLSSEYFVLDGAKALAIPTKFGQDFSVRTIPDVEKKLHWKAIRSDGTMWLNLTFDKQTLESNSDSNEAKTLNQILKAARELNPDFLLGDEGISVETKLEFPNDWGLGSSSTLIFSIAQWAKIDAHTLLQKSIGGSGYDVACAGIDDPVIYQLNDGKAVADAISFSPTFKEHIYFAYLGKKQLSSSGINHYRESKADKKNCIKWLNVITDSMLSCASIEKFEQLIDEHEQIIADALSLKRVQQNLFTDYWGKVKSLGAWGGDFVMLTNTRSRKELQEYLNNKGIEVIFRFDEMIYEKA